MRERIDRFADEIQNKKHVQHLVSKLDLCLKIKAESGTFYLSFKDGKVACRDSCIHDGYTATISGNDALLNQLFDGDLKLRQGVIMNYFTTDCPFRAQLVLESLFYLARPLPV
ncbi:SCP2 sterol-binding domain-containing protein [Mesobacillus jeotgali]|uniref:SCP2 sterol-binding domain-containing protein n=1 Tax=Mesobacillus jeotgali TaxID=129985 RepID=UPI000C81F1F3|nr:SCP2 sterol-binding domain-containing protein [Mesobacillus jeotgali]